MLRRPTHRRHSHSEHAELPLVPILDTLVTLISFLLFTTSFLHLVGLETLLPKVSTAQSPNDPAAPLQLTLTLTDSSAVISSPFNRIKSLNIPRLPDHQLNLSAIRTTLVTLKQRFPNEDSLVLIPQTTTSYNDIILLMDTTRHLLPSDPPIFMRKKSTGVDQAVAELFPNIIFGHLSDD